MKIAFVSCIDAVADPVQPVWVKIKDQQPDVLLLLGDLMYMDFGLAPLSRRPLGWPRKVGNDVFAATMYARYLAQWSVPSFRDVLASGVTLGMIWDDHDFAWNNARGLGTSKYYAVNADKRLIAQGLFRQFRSACENVGALAYPAMPALAVLLGAEEKGIQTSFDRDAIRFIMLDGRSYREDPSIRPDADLHGYAQREWLRQQIAAWPGLVVIGSGSVLTGAGECWSDYLDYSWLLGTVNDRVIVLSGDIHKNVLPTRHGDAVVEVTSSGAARPGLGGARGNYGVLEVGVDISATLYSLDTPFGSSAAIRFQKPA